MNSPRVFLVTFTTQFTAATSAPSAMKDAISNPLLVKALGEMPCKLMFSQEKYMSDSPSVRVGWGVINKRRGQRIRYTTQYTLCIV